LIRSNAGCGFVPEPSIINEKTIADFTWVVEQTGILEREPRTA
jgi:hypothetical protein